MRVIETAVVAGVSVVSPPVGVTANQVAHRRWSIAAILSVIAALAVIAYLPVFHQPFVSDDYIQIELGRQYGPVSSWWALANDPLYRCRATSILLTHWTEQLFGVSPLSFYSTSVLLHVLSSLLLFATARFYGFARWPSAAAAGFFAVYLGHQEAVMWYAAVHELLLFLFCLSFVLCWTRWLRRGGSLAYAGASLSFAFALLSKEPGVVLVPLGLLIAAGERQWRKGMAGALPLAAVSLLYAYGIFVNKPVHLHQNDGTFSLGAPFYLTWVNSMGRMLWIWGLLSLIAIALWNGWKANRRLIVAATLWAGLTLLPFCFLAYMPRIPSRHTYLASAGLALLVAAGFATFHARFGRRRWAVPTLAAILIAHHCGYLWTKKRQQFLARAEATETILNLARAGVDQIYVRCFPYGPEVAEAALRVALNKPTSMLVWSPPQNPNVPSVCSPHP